MDRHVCVAFGDRNIPWENCIGYSSDNASVMTGKSNSVLSRLREKNPAVFNLGCVCHLANLCAQAGIKALPLPVEDLLVDVYFHFFHSAKRKEIYKTEFLDFTETEPLKILKHCSTRWLSLQKCVTRLLQQWPALQSYFSSHDDVERPGRVQKVRDFLTDPEMFLYYNFLSFVLPILNEFNTTFQAGAAMIGHLHSEMVRLLRRLMGKFVKTAVITASRDLTSVNFTDRDNQHDDDNIAVGLQTREYLKDNQVILPPHTVTRFFASVRSFYLAVISKMVKKFPFSDETLKALAFLNPDTREKVTSDEVVQLGKRFTPELPATSIDEEVQEYLLSPRSELPPFDLETTLLDNFWMSMSKKKLPSGSLQYGTLSKVAMTALCIAHSNADAERSFSMLKKIQTDTRHNLAQDTIHSLLSVKMNNTAECHQFKPSKDIIRVAKSACTEALRQGKDN